jgi:hypothetical protein
VAGIVDANGPAPSVEDVEHETDFLFAEGLSAIVVHALGEIPAHRGQPYFAMFRRSTLNTQMKAMAADTTAAPALEALAAAGVRTAVVKGPAMAALHPQGWPRTYSDIDLIVTPDDFPRAIRCVEDLGFATSERAIPQWEWFDLRCREGVNLHSAGGGNLDVHHHVPPWSFGSRIRAGDILRRSEPAELCGTPVQFASAGDLLLISALHVLNDLWKGKAGLASWRDVLVLLHRLGADQARAVFAEAGIAWLHDLMVAELARSVPEAGIAPPSTLEQPSRAERVRLAALGWSGHSMATRQRLAWVSRLPVANGMLFLAGTLVPSPAYVRDRHGSYLDYWRRGLSESVSTAKGSDYRMTTVDDYE